MTPLSHTETSHGHLSADLSTETNTDSCNALKKSTPSTALFPGSATDPPSNRDSATPKASSSHFPMTLVMVHFYHYDTSTDTGNVVVASSAVLEDYLKIMDLVQQAYDLRQRITPQATSEVSVVMVDMSFMSWKVLKDAIEFAHTRNLRIEESGGKRKGKEKEGFQPSLENLQELDLVAEWFNM